MGLILMYVFLCRGLIYQAHLFEYINELNGFYLSYVCVLFICTDSSSVDGIVLL